jgi:hypothetical protein
MDVHLPATLQETQLLVRNDALHVGARCVKRGPTKGICDLCHILRGESVPETTRHIVLDCPFSKPVVMAIWRNGLLHMNAEPLTDPPISHDAFCDLLERRIIFGVPDFDPPHLRPPRHLRTVIATLAAATNAALIRRRNHNALNTALPIQYDPQRTAQSIMRSTCDVATALRTKAEREETRIYTNFEGWLPEDEDERPVGKWTHAWCAVVRDTHPRVCLFASTPFKHTQHSLQCPDVDTADPDVVSRLDARSKISY